ncbi:uncharacterized protein LOC128557064 [Mercenaria mercenaria]|uniref:uncharacterized protein LOC128557064 n=1 Tax=Mercenaria mercenaria TaxID=6596 RepID=UPI00234F5FB0|nr:uncharacterized protein LOC128557064 [Mercenaria mercenaria]
MSSILNAKQNKMKYDRANLLRAFQASQKGMSVYRASREYNVPESTLRGRTRGLVAVDVTVGFKPLFSLDEEEKLVKHISYMAGIGYGYNVSKIKYMTRDYALHLGKLLSLLKVSVIVGFMTLLRDGLT